MQPLPATSLRRPALLAAVLSLGLLVTPGSVPAARAQSAHELTIDGTTFLLNGAPFDYTGVSFFNALYNPAFNERAAARRHWLERFKRYGINVLRVWGQWDNRRGFVDTCAECTLYHPDGSLRQEPLQRLQALNVWRVGAYASYHHDMFQTGYGTPAVPPSGIPDPEFSPYHRQVFEFLARRDRYRPVPGR